MMRRRDAIRAMVVSSVTVLGGCATNGGRETDRAPTPTERHRTQTERSPKPTDHDPSPTESVTSTDTRCTDPDSSGTTGQWIDPRVSISGATDQLTVQSGLRRSATTEHPPRIRLQTQSRRRTDSTFQFGSVPPLGGLRLNHQSRDSTLVLVPVPIPGTVSVWDRNEDGNIEIVPPSRSGECWRAIDLPGAQDYFEARQLEPCEVHTADFDVLGHPDNEGCPPQGIYERTDEWSVRETEFEGEVTLQVTVSGSG